MTKQLPLFGQPRGSIPFAPEGWRFIIPTAIMTADSTVLAEKKGEAGKG